MAVRICDQYMHPWPPEAMPARLLDVAAEHVCEACGRAQRADTLLPVASRVLSSDTDWDTRPGYYNGQTLKSIAEVLRATNNRPEAVTVAALAHRLQDRQPFLQLTCRELLDLLAEEMSEADYREAIVAAEDMKPSEAIALARGALGL